MNTWNEITQTIEKKSNIVFATCHNIHDLMVTKNKLIGKKSHFIQTFKNLTIEEKKNVNQQLKEIKIKIENIFQTFKKQLTQSQLEKKIQLIDDQFSVHKIKFINDQTLIQVNQNVLQTNLSLGQDHPLNMIIEQIHRFCNQMNWKFNPCEELTNVETNFTLLNIEEKHPARQKANCFYIDEKYILRTHATNNTAKILSQYKENNHPQFIYTIGNVYRNDTDDATHLPQFSQFDVCLIDEHLSLAHLKGILIQFCRFLFDEKIQYRFRSSYFPFTEPSLEMDIRCTFCQGKGCHICSNEGWIELLGGGIINPEVLKKCKIPETKIILAFGIGIERIVMLKYKISDIRHLYTNNLERNHK